MSEILAADGSWSFSEVVFSVYPLLSVIFKSTVIAGKSVGIVCIIPSVLVQTGVSVRGRGRVRVRIAIKLTRVNHQKLMQINVT